MPESALPQRRRKLRRRPRRREAAAKKAESKETPVAKPEAVKAEKVEKAEKAEHPKGMPVGYESMTIPEIKEAVPGWNAPMLAAALEYEQEHGKRKGALAALEAAIAAKEDS